MVVHVIPVNRVRRAWQVLSSLRYAVRPCLTKRERQGKTVWWTVSTRALQCHLFQAGQELNTAAGFMALPTLALSNFSGTLPIFYHCLSATLRSLMHPEYASISDLWEYLLQKHSFLEGLDGWLPKLLQVCSKDTLSVSVSFSDHCSALAHSAWVIALASCHVGFPYPTQNARVLLFTQWTRGEYCLLTNSSPNRGLHCVESVNQLHNQKEEKQNIYLLISMSNKCLCFFQVLINAYWICRIEKALIMVDYVRKSSESDKDGDPESLELEPATSWFKKKKCSVQLSLILELKILHKVEAQLSTFRQC